MSSTRVVLSNYSGRQSRDKIDSMLQSQSSQTESGKQFLLNSRTKIVYDVAIPYDNNFSLGQIVSLNFNGNIKYLLLVGIRHTLDKGIKETALRLESVE